MLRVSPALPTTTHGPHTTSVILSAHTAAISRFLPRGTAVETYLLFNGVNSAYYVWINGQKVGYSQDSRMVSEFNITKYLQPGKNSIAVEVYRWSDGSYMEDQDFWRMSGIFRDVTLVSRAPLHIRDFQVLTPFDGTYENATFKLHVSVQNTGAAKACRLGRSEARRRAGQAGILADQKGEHRRQARTPSSISSKPSPSQTSGPPRFHISISSCSRSKTPKATSSK